MGVALDLSRLRREAISTPRGGSSTPHTFIESPWRGIDVGMTIEGKYRVDALIGRGGMGAVYRARDLRLDRDVAVKVVRGELVASPEARDRFQREAQLAARLQHPAIVTVFDYGTLPDGAAYLVMEYVRGEDLRARLSKGPLPAADAIALLAEIAEGVEAAHRESVLHRDLKPENVLLPVVAGRRCWISASPSRCRTLARTPHSPPAAPSSGPRPTWRPSRFAANASMRAPTFSAWR